MTNGDVLTRLAARILLDYEKRRMLMPEKQTYEGYEDRDIEELAKLAKSLAALSEVIEATTKELEAAHLGKKEINEFLADADEQRAQVDTLIANLGTFLFYDPGTIGHVLKSIDEKSLRDALLGEPALQEKLLMAVTDTQLEEKTE